MKNDKGNNGALIESSALLLIAIFIRRSRLIEQSSATEKSSRGRRRVSIFFLFEGKLKRTSTCVN